MGIIARMGKGWTPEPGALRRQAGAFGRFHARSATGGPASLVKIRSGRGFVNLGPFKFFDRWDYPRFDALGDDGVSKAFDRTSVYRSGYPIIQVKRANGGLYPKARPAAITCGL